MACRQNYLKTCVRILLEHAEREAKDLDTAGGELVIALSVQLECIGPGMPRSPVYFHHELPFRDEQVDTGSSTGEEDRVFPIPDWQGTPIDELFEHAF